MTPSDELGSATLPLQALMDHLLRDGMRQGTQEARNAFTLLEQTLREILAAQLDERKRALAALSEIIGLALRDLSLEEKLQRALDCILAIPSVHGLDQGCLFLVDEAGGALRMVAQRHLPAELTTLCRHVPYGECLCGRAMEETKPIQFHPSIDEVHTREHPAMLPHGHTLFLAKNLQTDRPLMLVNLYVRNQCREDPRAHFLIDAVAMALSVLHALHVTQEELRGLAYRDPVTGLANRRIFQDRLDQARRRAVRNRESFMVLALGVDRFGRINESLGRAVGDQVLRLLAERFKETMRAGDTLAKADGGEFLFLMFIRNVREIMSPVQRIRALIADPLPLEERELRVTVSIGISLFPDDGEKLLEQAQFALKSAKEQGPGQFQVFSSEAHAKTLAILALEQDLRKAVAQRLLTPHYQPQISLASMKIIGFEALIRWPDPERPDRMRAFPDQFIPLAEETGLIVPLGEQVLPQACRDLKAWHDLGYRDLHMAVNLSARQFASPTLLTTITQALSDSGLPPRHLELEITESQVMLDKERAREVLLAIKELGVQLALDDFGTGYSSLSILQQFPFDRLKIDRSFVMNLPTQTSNLNMINTIIQMARGLQLLVTAEGVENQDQQDKLKLGGCNDVQGWLYSKALPADRIPELLARYNIPHTPESTKE
ncbi:MAG: EAL domain-containing protein [Magnetococcales bacterium]|nr:EAL domain-containing protein [Magnetococcales bacterium]